jgi:uncharacterized protein (DUF342 family)
MERTAVTISESDQKSARIEGAQQLGVQPDEVTIARVDAATYTVSMKNAPAQLDIVVQEDKMAAIIRAVAPHLGNGKPLTVEGVEQTLSDLNIVVGIDKEAIENIVSEVAATGTLRSHIQVAVGEPVKKGEDGRIEMKIGQGAVNEHPQARNIVKPGQTIAIRVPPTKGMLGRNVFGEEVPAKEGRDIEFSAGDNVTVDDERKTYISTTYGEVKANLKGASVTNLVKISSDKMWAEIPIFPELADNSKLTFKDVAAALEQAGVVHGIKEEVITEALEAGKPVQSLRAAEATPAKDGVDTRIEFEFRLNGDDPESVDAARKDSQRDAPAVVKEMVSAGHVLAVKIPLKRPENGSTVTGKVFPGAEPNDKRVTAGANVRVLDDGVTFVVSEGVVGYADYMDGKVCVEDPLRVSEDKLRVFLSVQPPSRSGKMLTMELVEKLLADHGIVHGIDRKAIEQALTRGASADMPVNDVLIAEGIAPERGQDARIEFKILPNKVPGTHIGVSDRIDYKELGSIKTVKKGDPIAIKIPLTQGKEGIDVFGDIIPTEPGIDKVLKPAGNVAVSEDGLTFTAEIDGMVALVQENKIGVLNKYGVSGDVDYSTGNLSMEGSLDIKGWIRSGFAVKASVDIQVGGGIEDAIVEAGANIKVNGGIIGSGEGRIHAGGDLMARFLENAHAHAEGNIFVRDDVMRSTLSANGKIIVTEGKGRIRGGVIEAAKGIEVNEIGSEAGIKTHVSVGTDLEFRKRMADVTKQLSDLKQNSEKMDMVLARYANEGKGKVLSKETGQKLEKLAKLRRETALEEDRLAKEKKDLEKKISQADVEGVKVKVQKAIYSGTTVVVQGHPYHIKEDIRGKAVFIFNPEEQVVELVR